MKTLATAALIAMIVGQPALARTTETSETRTSQTEGDRLSRTERLKLQAEVTFYQAVLVELRRNQRYMDKYGYEHNNSWQTITFGTATALAEIAAGGAMIYFLPQERFVAYDKEVRTAYQQLNTVQDEIKALKKERDALVGEATKTEAAAELGTKIEAKQTYAETLVASARKTQEHAPLWKKLQRPIRLTLAATVAPLLIIDGVAKGLQIGFDPQYSDDLANRLENYVRDARETLDRR